jgi:hypothetical protein
MEEVEEEKRKDTPDEQEHDALRSSWFDRVDLELADPEDRPVLEAEIAYHKEIRRIEEDSQEIARTIVDYSVSPPTDDELKHAMMRQYQVDAARLKQLERDREIAGWRYACAKPYIEERCKEPWRKRLAYLESLPDVRIEDVKRAGPLVSFAYAAREPSLSMKEEPKAEEVAADEDGASTMAQAASQEE